MITTSFYFILIYSICHIEMENSGRAGSGTYGPL